jgi:hypothetical protein
MVCSGRTEGTKKIILTNILRHEHLEKMFAFYTIGVYGTDPFRLWPWEQDTG